MRRSNLLRRVMIVAAVAALAAGIAPAGAFAAPYGAQAALTAVSGTGAGQVLIAPTAEDQGTFAVEWKRRLRARARPTSSSTAGLRSSPVCNSTSNSEHWPPTGASCAASA
jgi:hypothetical protein